MTDNRQKYLNYKEQFKRLNRAIASGFNLEAMFIAYSIMEDRSESVLKHSGKYERYKPFTGLDEPVIKFLEDDGEIYPFLEHAYALVDAHVKRYMERGFSNLMVCFGCTGGQHRSVYSAQHMAEHIHEKFGVKVELIHREQNIEQTFEAKL